MLTVHPNLHTLPADWHARLTALSTAVISDALTSLGIYGGGSLPGYLQCLAPTRFSHTTSVVGLVTTVYAPQGTSLPLHLAMYTHATERFLIVATNGWTDCAYIGDIQGATAERNGCIGLCIDGYIRDRRGLAALTIPIYARGSRPNAPDKQELGSINTPITIDGLTIHNGDIAVADEDGVVIIPYALTAETLVRAEQKESADNRRLAAVMAFDFTAASTAEEYTSIMNAAVREYVKGIK